MTTWATDSTTTGGRGSPNAWSPGSDANNWTQRRSNQTPTFVSNQLVSSYNGSGSLGIWTYGPSETNQEVLSNFTQSNLSNITGAILRWTDNSHYYYADIGNAAGKVEIGLGGSFTQLGQAGFTATANTKYSMRFQAIGTTLKVRIWDASTAEPGTWNVTVTDSTNASGFFGICTTPVSGATDKFDTFSATDGATGVTHFLICDGLGGVFS